MDFTQLSRDFDSLQYDCKRQAVGKWRAYGLDIRRATTQHKWLKQVWRFHKNCYRIAWLCFGMCSQFAPQIQWLHHVYFF